MARRVLVVQHGDDCPPLRVGRWLADRGCDLVVVRGQHGEPLPESASGLAGLVVLGGQMGACDDARHPWLTPTKELLRAAVAADLPTLGVCLGHQLLGVACGGRIARTSRRQVGLFPVDLTAAGRADPLLGALPLGAVAVHANVDLVVEPPPAAVVLARSPAGIQAMRVGSALGLQFHPEVDPPVVRGWLAEYVAAGALDAADAARRLAAIEAADGELQRTWEPIVQAFAASLRSPLSATAT